jgi:4'-phosphopantetheinyl transferase
MEVLPAGEVHVWHRPTTDADAHALAEAAAVLSAPERERRDALRVPDDRRDYTLAHDLLRRTLSRYASLPPAEWRFASNPFGKPAVALPPGSDAPPLSFSLSHTRGYVACAVARDLPVGVDVERIDRARDAVRLADRYFSAAEAAALRRCDGDARGALFGDLWTLKEAFVKAIGLGLSQPFTDLSFEIGPGGAIRFTPPASVNAAGWHFALFEPSPGLRLAVAACAAEPPRIVSRQDRGSLAR